MDPRRGAALLGLAAGTAATWGAWQQVGPLPHPVTNTTAVTVAGSLFAVGGDEGGAGDTVQVQVFVRDTWTWSAGAPNLVAGISGPTTAVPYMDTHIVVAADGASHFDADRPRLQIWNVAEHGSKWKVLEQNSADRYAAGVAGFGDSVWVVGGLDSSTGDVLASVDVYSVASGRWTTGAELPAYGSGAAGVARPAVAVANTGGSGTLFVLGGLGAAGGWTNIVYNRTSVDASVSFACPASLLNGLEHVAFPVAAAVGDSLWLLGDTYSGDRVSGGLSIYMFNLYLGTWQKIATTGVSPWRHSSALAAWTSGLDQGTVLGNLFMIGGSQEADKGGAVSGATSVTPSNRVPVIILNSTEHEVGEPITVRVIGGVSNPEPLRFRLADSLQCDGAAAGTKDQVWSGSTLNVRFLPTSQSLETYLCYSRGRCAPPGAERKDCDITHFALREYMLQRGYDGRRAEELLNRAKVDPAFACAAADCCFDSNYNTGGPVTWQCSHPVVDDGQGRMQYFVPLLLGKAMVIKDPPSPTPAPSTPAPATDAPDTLAPTPVPATDAPDTPAPRTDAPSTPAPTTPAPPTPAPTTPAPETDAPDTIAPTPAPETDAPVTPVPPTHAPATHSPATPAPQTPAPTPAPTPVPTPVPPTDPPATPAPHTAAPQTDSPHTAVPWTHSPHTERPATPAPGTPSPQTMEPATDSPATLAPATPGPPVSKALSTGTEVMIGLGALVIVGAFVACVCLARQRKQYTGVGDQGVSQYSIMDKLGSGGYGFVFLVQRKRDGKYFALKYITVESDQERRDAIAEFEVMRSLQGHPNLITLIDMFMSWRELGGPAAGTESPTGSGKELQGHQRMPRFKSAEEEVLYLSTQRRYVCIVMTYYEHGDLKRFILSHVKPMPEVTVWYVSLQICSALCYMHNMRPPVMHRDLKPENILLCETPDGHDPETGPCLLPRAVITDLGLARGLDTQTYCNTQAGSLPFVAPECWQRHYTVKIDMWALGCIVYAMFSRRADATRTRVMFSDVHRPSFAKEITKDITDAGYPPDCAAITLRLLDPDPHTRPSSAETLLVLQEQLLAKGVKPPYGGASDAEPSDAGETLRTESRLEEYLTRGADCSSSAPNMRRVHTRGTVSTDESSFSASGCQVLNGGTWHTQADGGGAPPRHLQGGVDRRRSGSAAADAYMDKPSPVTGATS